MSDKKFSLLSFEYGLFEDNETGKGFDMEKCVELLNSMYDENKQLKQDKTNLHRTMSKEKVRYLQFRDKVFDLIDDKIKEAEEGFQQTYDSWYQGQIDSLKELKKVLKE